MSALLTLLFCFAFVFLWYSSLGMLGIAIAWSVLAVAASINNRE